MIFVLSFFLNILLINDFWVYVQKKSNAGSLNLMIGENKRYKLFKEVHLVEDYLKKTKNK